jgi:glycosyltransferase involved in cell wall biosynthesis
MLITATIITLNESANLPDCIASLKGVVDEIVVLDSLSTDGTQELARSLGATVIEQAYLGDGPQKACAAAHASHDWILSIDADERVEDDLRHWLKTTTLDEHCCYAVRRRNFMGDHWIRAAGYYPDTVVRLYHRSSAGYTPTAGHARVDGNARQIKTDAHLTHLTYRDLDHMLERVDWLSTRDAQGFVKAGRRARPWDPLIHASTAWLRKMVTKRGILHGRDGRLIARMTARKAWLKYSKARVLQRGGQV